MTTITTTTAATQAGVTVATIRTWCRRNVVAAVKTGGRWVIDTASLAHRLTIGAMRKTNRPAQPVTLTVDNIKAIGGNEWIRGDYHRVYLNDWTQFAGIEITRYNTGNISSAGIGGRGIANGRAYDLLGAIDKLYFDAADGKLHVRHYGADAYDIRYLNGDRDQLNLIELVFAGVRAAVAAL